MFYKFTVGQCKQCDMAYIKMHDRYFSALLVADILHSHCQNVSYLCKSNFIASAMISILLSMLKIMYIKINKR